MNAAQLPGTSLSGTVSTAQPESLPALFAAQAARTPDAIAVVEGGGRAVDYRTLDTAAEQVARFLRAAGAGPGTLVGVCLDRGSDLVATLLGVGRAGAAYLPLDPSHPQDRLTALLTGGGAAVVIAEPRLAARIAPPGVQALTPADIDATGLADAPFAAPDPAAVVCTIFTSGSTGQPKGVQVTHAGLAGRIAWSVRKHGLDADDRWLFKTSAGFDAAGLEIYAPLISGGRVVCAPEGAERDPRALLGAVADGGVTVLQAVPSVLRLLAEESGWAGCDRLRLLFSAGEPLHAELVARLRQVAPGPVEVWNTYGPTECSIDITAHPAEPGQESGPVPIGRPLKGMRVLVMGTDGSLAPKGVAGELYAGGTGLAQGYAGRPDLTAERFVPDAYGPPGSRLYRTGDLVRWNTDGVLEYLGRLDDQLKVNGVRIEPGEVEAALTAHPEVTGAVVVAFTAADGGRRIGAAFTARSRTGSADLRRHLRTRLPDSHVPSLFLPLDALPLTANGKADRKAVTELLDETTAGGQDAYVAPRTPAEQQVADVWAALLGCEKVGATDDFFALGGTSLQLTRLAARLRAAGVTISMRGLFSATTVEAQARLIDAPAADADALTAVPRTGELPLSSGQRRLWVLDRMNPGSREWVAPLILRLPAATPVDAVQAALDELSARHEILRTRYQERDGEPRQVIGAPLPVELRVTDTGREELAGRFEEQFARGFDLAAGPLWRALLARVPGEDHVLLVTLHHIACDGWSTVVLERELRELCAASAENRAPQLAAPGLQYADYAAWQSKRLTDAFLAGELAFWRAALDGVEPVELPADRPRPAERDSRGAVVPIRVEPELFARVEELGRAHAATPFMTLLTVFATVVARYSGRWDVPVGTPVAGRGRPEVAGTVGFFLNSLVVRCALEGDPTFEEALGRVRAASVAAFSHQDLPFDRLVDELAPERDLSRTPLYQVAFDMHSEGVTSVATGTADLTAFAEAWTVAKTDLSVFVGRSADGALEGVLEYATALFDEATVVRFMNHFVRVMEEVTARPGVRLSEVALLSPEERTLVLDVWNATGTGLGDASVVRRFEEQARATPEAPAVSFGDASVTYKQLDLRADQLAHHLRGLGVHPHTPVGVLLDRGPNLLAAFLGVWKAGASYVPIDPSYPAERIASMLETAGAAFAVTQEAYEERFSGFTTVLVDRDRAAIDACPRTAPERGEDPQALAYTIFTSGSTGRPKGVEVTHRGLANHVAWAARELASQGQGGAPLFSSVAFDLVVPNLWAPLVTGQKVHTVPQDTDMADLGQQLAGSRPYSFIKLTPGHLDILAEQLTPEQAASLAPVLVVAGEAFTRTTLERWRTLSPHTRIINEYGPTEASVGTCVYPVPADETAEVLPIGTPLPNMTMYVLDAALEPTPVGVPGELYVGGTGVARGYAGRPDLTADRFLPDPYGTPGDRLYRTGDLARTRPDGTVEFLGRLDDQIKIRGYRIEPGEIQSVLTDHPAIRDTVVIPHTTPTGETHLAAYYVADHELDPADLTKHAATHLPDYMLPTTYTPLTTIPLNTNGKTDKNALPHPDNTAGPTAGIAPRTVTEERIADIWSELLGTRVGVEDSFFQSGGNSILAIRLISRIQEEFDIDFKVRTVFEGPTVARLAAAVEAAVAAEIDAELAAYPPAAPPHATPTNGQALAKEFTA